MAVFNKFHSAAEQLAEKGHNFGSDPLMIMLTNVAPAAANNVKADITEIAAGNGYTAGGAAVVVTSSAQAGGIYKAIANDIVFTATGGPIGPFRYPVLYNTVGNLLIGWWDYGSSITLASGEALTIDLSPTNGILQLT